MQKLNKKTKITIILCAILFSLVICEVFLNISSFINKTFVLPCYNLSDIDKNSFVIFCFGDSYTYGVGAGFENSYPARLEEILNEHSKSRPVQVFNFGVPGYNSSQVLNRLKQVISQSKPDAVVILCGGNDSWNFDRVAIKFTPAIIKSLITRLKIYKMLVIFTENIKHRISKPNMNAKDNPGVKILKKENDFFKLVRYGNTHRDFGYYTQAELFYEKAIKFSVSDRLVFIELGRCYKLNRQYHKAIHALGRLLNDNPLDKQSHEEIRDTFIRSKMIEESISFYEDFLKKFPGNQYAVNNLIGAYKQAAGEYFLSNQMQKAKIYYKKIIDLNPQLKTEINTSIKMIEDALKLRDGYVKLNMNNNPNNLFKTISGYYFINAVFAKRITSHILFENLLKMAKICRKNHIEIFFSTYPDAGYMDNVSSKIRKLAQTYEITIICHYNSFLDALKKHPYSYYFVSRDDPHCTKAGYGIMAENIAQAIIDKCSF